MAEFPGLIADFGGLQLPESPAPAPEVQEGAVQAPGGSSFPGAVAFGDRAIAFTSFDRLGAQGLGGYLASRPAAALEFWQLVAAHNEATFGGSAVGSSAFFYTL